MTRYVVLYHQTPPNWERGPHWDLMLEHEGVLWTWTLAAEPTQPQTAERLGDHRLAYLDYEGPLSGERGEVSRWDSGTYAIVPSLDDDLTIELFDGRLAGRIRLGPLGTNPTTYDYTWRAC
jgi:hypothetical protein